MNTKIKFEIEMNKADYLAVTTLARRRRSSIDEAINNLVSDALEKVDPRDFEAFPYEASSIFGDEITDEYSAIADLVADKF